MKISREFIINGESQNVEYELTGIELERCYNEYVELHDRNEVLHQLRDLEYEDIENIPEDIIADLASQVREKMEEYRDDAILSVIRQNGEILEKYKEAWKSYDIEYEQTRRHIFSVKAKRREEAEELFCKWKERNRREFDDTMNDEDEYDGCICSTDETSDDPDYADISEEVI